MVNKENYHNILKECKEQDVQLISVSKTKPVEDLEDLYAEGCRVFGENKVQEITTKYETLPKDIQWHFIGHLQSNKVKYIAPFVQLIHAVDSAKLLGTVQKEALKNDRTIDVLLQFHIATESSKFGLSLEEVKEVLTTEHSNVNVRGVMGMATFTDNVEQVRNEFKQLKHIFDTLKQDEFKDKTDFDIISMGMSGDYKIAIEEGSTMVRVGSSIFGSRS